MSDAMPLEAPEEVAALEMEASRHTHMTVAGLTSIRLEHALRC